MSGFLGGILSGTAIGGIGGALTTGIGGQLVSSALGAAGIPMPAFIRQGRKIDTIIPDVTIEEHFTDRLTVTQHPVAKGTPVSDHAYLMPKAITMKCGWTNANLVGSIGEGIGSMLSGGSIGGALSSAASTFMESRAKDIYEKLLALQLERRPFTLTTGKRTYEKNMVITELDATNDHHTEYALIISVQMQEVILVDVGDATQADQDSQTKPQTTQPTQDGGNKPAAETPVSHILGSIFPGLKVGNYNPVK